MFRILPSISGGQFHIPWYTLFVFYFVEVALAVAIYGTTTVNHMSGIGFIPEEYLIAVAASIIVAAFVMYVVFYLMSYQDRKSKVLADKAEALAKGVEVDSVAIASIENFHTIYIVAMALGIVVTSALSFALVAAVLGDYVSYNGVVKVCAYAVVTTIVVFGLFDYFVGRRIADGTFKLKVIDPLEKAIVAKFEEPAEETAEAPAPVDEKVQLIAQLLAEISKKQ